MASGDTVHELECHIQRSIRYHRARERFFAGWSRWISFLSLLSGSAVVVSLLAKLPDWVALSFGAFVAALQASELIWSLSDKARLHADLAVAFLGLEQELARLDTASISDIRTLRADILRIEAREPPIKRYLDLICHNQVARAIGSDDIEKLSFRQRLLAQYLNGDTALQK